MSTSCCSGRCCGPLSYSGIGGAGRRIWSSVIWKNVLSSKPPPASERAARNASSRFGPTVPRVAASASVWQPPHCWTKRSRPWIRSAPEESAARPAQPASGRRAPTRPTHRRRRPSNAVCLGLGSLADARDRFIARLVDVEDLVQPRDLEDLRNVSVAADEGEPASIRAEPLDAPDEDAERRRIDEGRLREVDDDFLCALPDHLEQLLLELGSGVEIDFPRQ